MASLYIGIILLISIFAYFDWKRTVLIWLPWSMLFNQCVCIRYAPPALTITLAVNFVIIGVYFIKKKQLRKHLSKYPFLFKKSFKAYLISYILSMLFSIVPLTMVFTGTIRYFVCTFAIVYLFHRAIENTNDLKLFIKASLVVFIPIIMLGLFEAIFHDNPWLDIVYLTVPDVDYVIGKMYYIPPFLSSTGDLDMRFGMVRCYSFFNIHIAFGCACVLYLFLFLYFNQRNYKSGRWLSTPVYLFISLLCVIGIVLCNSKTPMVGLPFLVMAAIPIKIFASPKGIATIMAVCFAVIIAMGYNENLFNNFLALFDKKIMEEGEGSTVDMRATQYTVGLSLFLQNPLFGNGIDSLGYIAKQTSKYADILGSESSWLKILPQQGLLGIVAYLILYREMFSHLKLSAGRKTAFFYCIGLILMETATGFMEFSIYAPAVIAVERYQQLNLHKMKSYGEL